MVFIWDKSRAKGMGRTWVKFSTLLVKKKKKKKKNTENLKPQPESKLVVSTIRVARGEKICQ